MTSQLTLELGPIVRTVGLPRSASIQDRFEAFHHANPWVYRAVVALSRQLVGRGRSRIGIGMIFEVLRWQYQLQTVGDDFKLNNNYRSRYARLIEDNCPDLVGVFEKRAIRTP